MRRLVASALLALLVLPGCGSDKKTGSEADSDASLPARGKPAVTVPAGAPPKTLQIRDIEVGTGVGAKNGDQLVMHYVGVAWSTKKEFDSSYNSGRPFPLTLGSGQVIPGWDQGLVGMKLGGRRELIIPPDLAYGTEGRKDAIKPNETLVFVVDLVQIQPA